MQERVVLVTGATGNAGYSLLQCLLGEKEQPCRIRAGVYEKSEKRDLVRNLTGLDSIYEYDADSVDDIMEAAFRGADYAYLVPPRSKNRVKQVRNFVDLAKKHNLKFLLLFSMCRPKGSTAEYARDYDAMERIVEDSGIPFAVIQSTLHQQTLFLLQPDILKGYLPLPIGRGRFAPINICDVSRLAHVVLREPMKYNGRYFCVSGPDLLDGEQIAKMASTALSRPVQFINISLENFRNLVVDSGLQKWLADEFMEMFAEIRDNKFAFKSCETVESITEHHALSLLEFFCTHKHRFTSERSMRPVEDYPEGIEEAVYSKTKISGRPIGSQVANMREVINDLRALVDRCISLQRDMELSNR